MIYLDNAATTKADQDVVDSFVKRTKHYTSIQIVLSSCRVQAEQLLLKAKSEINRILNLNNQFDIIFTSGATESNNILLKGIAYMKRNC